MFCAGRKEICEILDQELPAQARPSQFCLVRISPLSSDKLPAPAHACPAMHGSALQYLIRN